MTKYAAQERARHPNGKLYDGARAAIAERILYQDATPDGEQL